LKKKIIIGCSIVGAFFLGVIGTYLFIAKFPIVTKNIVENVQKMEISGGSIADSVEKIYDATVYIESSLNGNKISSGSGFVYKKENGYGYIMTNHHVINGADEIKITFSDDTTVKATLVGSEVYADIAVVRVEEKYVLQVAELGESESLRIGDVLFTVGSPLAEEYRGTVTKGIVSGKNRLVEVSLSGTSVDWIMKTIQFDAAINPGNSGGPLLNINGEVVGINSLKLVKSEIEGMGFAIPIEDAMYYVEQLESGKEIVRPIIGIQLFDVSESMYYYSSGVRPSSNVTKGIVVQSVVDVSPAQEAGLKTGDVIVAINSVEVDNKAEFRYELYKHEVGEEIEVTFYRDNRKLTTKIRLAKSE